jgi:short-subunit dehydrogenase
MKSFSNRVAAITGAASGIGRALAENLAVAGCHLALSDLNEKGLEETAELARAKGVNVTTAKLDVADRDAVYAWADQVVKEHGRVNLVFNNAGVGVASTIEGVDYEDFEWLMNINFWGVVYGSKAFLPHLKQADAGHIINLSSVFGIISVPTQGVYNAAKFAVRGFSDALRQELDIERSSVRVSCVYPGGIKTNIAHAARMSENIMGTYAESKEKSADAFLSKAITTPDKAAQIILAGVQRDARRILVGPDARVIDTIQRIFPALYQKVMVRGAQKRAQS